MTTSENPEQNLEPKEDETPVVPQKNEEQDHDHKPDSQAGPSKPEKFINPPVQRRRSSLKVAPQGDKLKDSFSFAAFEHAYYE